MTDAEKVREYKCPCCGSGLYFSDENQKLTCRSCENSFDVQDVKDYNDAMEAAGSSESEWEEAAAGWSDEERQTVNVYTCPSCAGELMTDENTAATFCPYCENPVILTGRLSGGLRPDGVLPFQTSLEDAKAAFLAECKRKPLLPKFFTEEQRIEKITGIYVPYWLYDCGCQASERYRGTRTQSWSDANYHYVRTSHYLLVRAGEAEFTGVPMDGSRKMEDHLMESLEPFDYSKLEPFHTGYLSGFLADKYDVDADDGKQRIRQRLGETMDVLLRETCMGYGAVTPTGGNLQVRHGKVRYVLLPVWILNTQYRGKTYTFAMNGQTGKITGSFPICPKRSWAWFGGICAGVTALVTALQWLF